MLRDNQRMSVFSWWTRPVLPPWISPPSLPECGLHLEREHQRLKLPTDWALTGLVSFAITRNWEKRKGENRRNERELSNAKRIHDNKVNTNWIASALCNRQPVCSHALCKCTAARFDTAWIAQFPYCYKFSNRPESQSTANSIAIHWWRGAGSSNGSSNTTEKFWKFQAFT